MSISHLKPGRFSGESGRAATLAFGRVSIRFASWARFLGGFLDIARPHLIMAFHTFLGILDVSRRQRTRHTENPHPEELRSGDTRFPFRRISPSGAAGRARDGGAGGRPDPDLWDVPYAAGDGLRAMPGDCGGGSEQEFRLVLPSHEFGEPGRGIPFESG